MLTLYVQRFSTRGQNVDLFRLPIELLGERGDPLDHMLTAIEDDKKLSRTNEVDQLQARVFRFECNSQGCRDSPRNLVRIGKAFQVNKIDFAAKLFGGGAANSAGNGRCWKRRARTLPSVRLRRFHLQRLRSPQAYMPR